jgi:hypothetical protein
MLRLEKDHQMIKEKEFIFQDQNIMMTSLSMLEIWISKQQNW